MGRSRKRGADGGDGTRPPTIVDVAARAQVSYQTVSRVLNEHPSVRPTTRQAVLDAMAGLGYRPSNAARTLVTGRSRTLGVLALDVADSDGLTPLYGIERSARELGYFVGIGNLTSVDRASVRAAVDHLAEQSVAGLLVIAPIDAADDALVTAPSDLPIVAVEGSRSGVVASAGVDQVAGARLATEHLLELGHDTVFHIRGPSEWMQTQDRVNGWGSALEAAGADVPMPLAGDWTAKSGYEAGQVLSRVSGLTAVFAGNDQTALGLLLAFSERGIRVPEDVSVVGFDDIFSADLVSPGLTTVAAPLRWLGNTAMKNLLALIHGAQSQRGEPARAPTKLVVRGSTAAVGQQVATRCD